MSQLNANSGLGPFQTKLRDKPLPADEEADDGLLHNLAAEAAEEQAEAEAAEDTRSSAEIIAELSETRDRIENTFDLLTQKVSPARLKSKITGVIKPAAATAVDYVKNPSNRGTLLKVGGAVVGLFVLRSIIRRIRGV